MPDVKQASNRVDEQVSLQSEDGVFFEVQKIYLMRASAVFRDTFALPTTQSKVSTAVPISNIVELFIGLIKHSRLPDIESDFFPSGHALAGKDKGVDLLATLLELLGRFDCGIALRDRAIHHFEPLFSADPWGAYCIAPNYDDLPMAKMAMRAVHRASGVTGRKVDVSRISVTDAGRVPLKWFLASCKTQMEMSDYSGELNRGQREYWDTFASWLKVPEE